MFSYWAYILIGNNNTGKTSFQRHLISVLCNKDYKTLRRNQEFNITHSRMPRGVQTLFTMNRSYQEKASEYGSVKNFFRKHFQESDICILSSHTHDPSTADLLVMIRELRLRAYNVAAVFLSNGYDTDAQRISRLNWDERLWISNEPIRAEDIQSQIARLAGEFAHMLIARAAQN
jgi:hypothetical protein